MASLLDKHTISRLILPLLAKHKNATSIEVYLSA